jgi:hypothetical protein
MKKWLLKQLVILDKNSGENVLYRFLDERYFETSINKSFTTFYENYVNWINDEGSMTKNFVFYALEAIGLRVKLVRIDFEERKKSAMVSSMKMYILAYVTPSIYLYPENPRKL